jgi:hypothetical protein
MTTELEALLIHAMGLQNMRQTKFPQGQPWTQVKDHERAELLEKLKPGRRPVQRRTRPSAGGSRQRGGRAIPR